MANKKLVKGLVIISLIILNIIIFFYDVQILRFIISLRNPFLDYHLRFFAFKDGILLIAIILSLFFACRKNKKCWIIPVWVTVLLSTIVAYLLQSWVARPRPFQTYQIPVLISLFREMQNSFKLWNFSFPSSHALIAFSLLPIFNKTFREGRYFWMIILFLFAFSEVYFGVNYPSDIFAGALIGYFIGCLMVFVEDKFGLGEKIKNKIINKLSK
jgi:undecaprenyl-diphosphatase